MLPRIDQSLPRTSPETQGIASAAVLRFVEALEIHEIHSFMLLRHGSVVAEGWWSPYGREYPHMLFSVSKSFTSTAVGLAVAEERFSLDDPVLSFFPDEAPAAVNAHLAAMRVRHLLTMSTGHAEDTWSHLVDRPSENWVKSFFEVPVLHTPGTHFLYNTGATYMLSAIVQKTTGMKLVDYLQARLFEPLGIENATWEESPQGVNLGGIGLSITTEDMARFGQLYLQNGMWQGRRLLSEAWISEATTARISNGDEPESDWTQGYGYQFWRCRHCAYRGDGVFGQFCIVMPEQDAVLAITGGVDVFDMQQPLNLVWEILLPAMDTLPDDADTQDTLASKLSSLSLPTVQGQAASPIASKISGQAYTVDANDLKIETIALNFEDSGCTLNLKTATGVETFPCGYGIWAQGKTGIFNEPDWAVPALIAISGAWTAEDCFAMIVRLVETPFFHRLVFHFVGDEMMVETWVNVSLESTKPLLLISQARLDSGVNDSRASVI